MLMLICEIIKKFFTNKIFFNPFGLKERDLRDKLSFFAQVVKLVDTPDLGSGAARHVGSSPILGKIVKYFF